MASDASGLFDPLGLLDALAGVDFIVVGGVAVSLYGGPRLTVDLDVVPERVPANVALLADKLGVLGAHVREPGERRIRLSLELLQRTAEAERGGQLRLSTDCGPLDVLWRLHDGRGFSELVASASWVSDGTRKVRVIGMDDLIDIKTSAGRAQDLVDVRYLQEIVRRRG